MAIETRPTRRTFLHISSVAATGATFAACTPPPPASPPPPPPPETPVANADEALARLLEGNRRYVANKSIDVNESPARRVELASEQKPFATILGCVDSRVPPELIFDRGLGDVFVIRTAGHVIDHAVLGSLEYGVEDLHVPLLMVLGHEKCGAVKATIECIEKHVSAPADINWLVDGIRPAVEQAKGRPGDLLDNSVKANVELAVARLKGSPILTEAIAKGDLKIVGARYDLDTGVVEITVP